MGDDDVARRAFLLGAGAAGSAIAARLASGETVATPTPGLSEVGSATAPPSSEPDALLTLNATEAAFLSAAVDALIPADDISPSGSGCGVVIFIDRQLASAWGGGDKMYRSGPFHPGTPEQGYQLPLSPRDYFAAGIVAANDWTRSAYGKKFDGLSVDDRISALEAMDQGRAEFTQLDARAFFNRLLEITMEGFFSDPIYGGNRNKVSWQMIGFPGLPATYANVVDEYVNKRYVAPPQSIADFL
jgi:gluconate 2-dehydrogenase gamma chain